MARPSDCPTTSHAAPKKKARAYDDWEAKDAMAALQRADEIVRTPGLHQAATRHAKKQMRALKRISSAKPMSKR